MHRMDFDDTGGKRTKKAKARDTKRGIIRRFPTTSRAFKKGFGDSAVAHHHPPNRQVGKEKERDDVFVWCVSILGKEEIDFWFCLND